MKKRTLTLLLIFFYSLSTFAQESLSKIFASNTVLPTGYRYPSKEDLQKDNVLAFGGWAKDFTFFRHDGSQIINKKERKGFEKSPKYSSLLIMKTEGEQIGIQFVELAEPRQEETKIIKKKNDPLTAFTLTNLANETIHSDDFKGKILVLNFWDTTCKPCIAEMPKLNQLKAKFDKKNVAFVSITSDDKPRVERFLTTHTFNYTHLVDAESAVHTNGVYSLPTNMIIDQNGTIRYISEGYRPGRVRKLQHQIEKLLK